LLLGIDASGDRIEFFVSGEVPLEASIELEASGGIHKMLSALE
jgi:hypothetical protein